MTRNRELEDVILADRDDPESYLVYADWLVAREDPRGELIVLQYQRLLEECHEYLEAHADLVPPVGAYLGWQWGFVLSARLVEPSADDFAELFEHPSCALLRELVIDATEDPVGVIAALAASSRPTIERLVIHLEARVDTSRRCDSRLWERLPNLAKLSIRAPRPLFDGISHPRIRELVIHDGHPLGSADWNLPALETLVWRSRFDVPFDRSLEDRNRYRPLASAHLPALRCLDLGDSLARIDGALLDLPELACVLPQLDVLVVPAQALGTNPGATLVARASRLAHLRELHVRSTTPATTADVSASLPNVQWR